MAQFRCTSRQTSTAKIDPAPGLDSFLNIASMAKQPEMVNLASTPVWVGRVEIYQPARARFFK